MSQLLIGDCRETLKTLPGRCVQTCITSPPYFGLRDYGMADQIGLEKTPDAYVAEMVAVFRAVRRVLKDDGTLWLNIGDSYAGTGYGKGTGHFNQRNDPGAMKPKIDLPRDTKAKDLYGIPWMLAFALRADGWYLRQDIIWHKPNPMPESIADRCTKSHEYVFLLSKSARYFFDAAAIAEPAKYAGRVVKASNPSSAKNGQGKHRETAAGFTQHDTLVGTTRLRRSVWTVPTKPYAGAHFAVMPEALVEPCILAGSRLGDIVLDPFLGSGTVARVAQRLGRDWIGCELNPAYAGLIAERTEQTGLTLG